MLRVTKPAKIRIISLAVASALALGACTSQSGTKVEKPVGAAVDAPRVALVSAGENPQVLEYKDLASDDQSKDDSPQQITVAIADGFDQQIVAADQVDPTAPAGGTVTTFTSPLSVETVAAGNTDDQGANRSVNITLGDSSIDNLDQAQDVKSDTGFVVGWFAKKSGQITSANFQAPTEATDTGRALVERYFTRLVPETVVFPGDAVGVGGSWTVDARVTDDSTMLQTTTYTITGIDGDKVSLDVKVAQRPAVGAITADLTDGTHTLNVLNSNTTTDGHIVVDLNQPLPVGGQIAFTTRVVYGEDSSQTRVVQDTTTSVKYGV